MSATTLVTLPTQPSALLADAPRMVGRFTIRGEIGRGSNGVVYSAFDPVLSREVAIKVIPLTHEGEFRQQAEATFLNEAKAAAGLNHPHIITVFDAGRTDTLAYLAMERLHGRDLHETIVDGRTLSFRQIASMLARVADAVHYAHKRGLVHRDIKPSNIFLLKDGKPKVLDFGVALAAAGDPGATHKRQLIGTPNYMSPEQALGRKLDARSDVFSIGTILYELLAGSRAFEGKTIDDTLAQVISDTPQPVESLRPNVPRRLIEIVELSLAKDIDRRYQTAGALRDDLAEFAAQAATAAANQSSFATQTAQAVSGLRVIPALLRRSKARVAIAAAMIVAIAAIGWVFATGDGETAAPVAAQIAPIAPASIDPAPLAVVEEPRPPEEARKPPLRPSARVSPVAAAKPAQEAMLEDGAIALAIAPWGEVFINGVSRGVSPPLSRIALPPGLHTIEVRNSAAPSFSVRVEVKPAQTSMVQHRF